MMRRLCAFNRNDETFMRIKIEMTRRSCAFNRNDERFMCI